MYGGSVAAGPPPVVDHTRIACLNLERSVTERWGAPLIWSPVIPITQCLLALWICSVVCVPLTKGFSQTVWPDQCRLSVNLSRLQCERQRTIRLSLYSAATDCLQDNH